ncbi:MAG: non-ribosomal peptide synthase [Labilithrix sp.]|nr:non-ribosomal peptide synthase [Labilithrix sp.]
MVDFPLSRNQVGLWWDWQLAPARPIYNTASAFRVKAGLDVDALRRGFQRIIDRHGSFRSTVVRGADGRVLQRRHDTWQAPFELHDASQLSEDELQRELLRAHEAPVDLGTQSSVELHVFTLSAGEHMVLLRFHHLFHDFGSTDGLHGELFEAYAAELEGRAPDWAPLTGQYDDFVREEQAFLASDEAQRSLDFWRARLADLTTDIDLPTDGRAGSTRAGATFTCGLGGRDALARFCKANAVSRYRVLLAAYVALLNRYSSQRHFAVGTPVDCRSTKYPGVAGYFANLLPFAFHVDADMSFTDLVKHVDGVVTESLAHRFIPFPTLIEKLWTGPRGGPTPFFRTTFALTKAVRCPALNRSQMSTHLPWSASVAGLDLGSPPPLPQQEGHFDLSFWLYDLDADGLALEVKYDPQLFSADAARRIAGHYKRLLEGALRAPEASLRSYELLGDEERGRIVRALRPDAPRFEPEPAHAAFARSVAARPGAIALRHGGVDWTYERTARWADALAADLQARGVAAGQLVTVLLPKSLEAVGAMLGILRAGCAFLPVDPTYPPERIAFMLKDSGTRIAVTNAALAGLLPEGVEHIDVAAERTGAPAARPITASSLAYVIYTSGSTGTPKGVLVPHRGVANLARALVADWSLDERSRLFAFAPLSFDACIADIFPTLMAGGTLHLGEEPWPKAGHFLSGFLARERISHVTLPPSVWLSMPNVPLPDLLVGVSAGEPCPREVTLRWGTSRAFFNNYGPTEITVCATTKRCRPGETPTIGAPIPGIAAYVLDASLKEVPIGVAGELCLTGEGLADGYLGREELTRERFVPVPGDPHARMYRTGDVVRLLGSGELEFVGRTDEQVKIRGFRIELAEVEDALRALDGIEDVAVAVRAQGEARVLVAYVVGDAEDVLQRARAHLPGHMVPSAVVRVGTLPRSPSGKVDRAALPAPELTTPGAAPLVGPVEQTIAGAWETVLGHARFGPLDDFFTVGGDSLTAVQVLHVLEQSLHTAFAPDALMRASSIRGLARLVTGTDAAGTVVELVASSSSKRPIVLVHPAGGDVSVYRRLTDRLRGDRRILAVRSPRTFDSEADEASLTSLAARYVADLRDAGAGSYHLVGWSLGGVIAQEMSRLLGEHERGSLFLLDASPSFPRDAVPDVASAARPELLAHHAGLYREHAARPSPAVASVWWAEGGVHALGAWASLCKVVSEDVVAATHEGLLLPPHIERVAAKIVERIEAGESAG